MASSYEALTLAELKEVQNNWAKKLLGDKESITVKGVYFSARYSGSSMSFSYKNATGSITADNGYLGNDRYYFLVNVLPYYCMLGDIKYSGTCNPTFEAMAEKIKAGWKRFASGN